MMFRFFKFRFFKFRIWINSKRMLPPEGMVCDGIILFTDCTGTKKYVEHGLCIEGGEWVYYRSNDFDRSVLFPVIAWKPEI